MSNAFDLKKKNMLQLLQTIYLEGSLTKPDLARMTHLTLPTVHNFVTELTATQVVREIGTADSQGGRRASLYEFNMNLFNILGVRMALGRIELGLFDLKMRCSQYKRVNIDFQNLTAEEGMQSIIDSIATVMKEWSISKKSLLGIGLTVPGPVDPSCGMILKLPNFSHWKSVPAKSQLERAFHVKAILEKDSLSNVIGLKWLNQSNTLGSVVYLVIEMGIGVGLLNNGLLLRGKNCMLGEIGHISLDENGPLCNCGNRGCLEWYASDIGIIQRVKQRLLKDKDSQLYDLCDHNLATLNMNMILAAAHEGNALALNEMEFSLKYIAICITNIIKLYDPDKIILGHRWLKDFPEMYHRTLEYVYMNSLFANHESLNIQLNEIDNLELMASAAIVLQYQFAETKNCKFLRPQEK